MTLEQFRDHLATQIGIKGRGNTLTDDDANYLETIIDNGQGELEQLGVALWSTDDIPSYAVDGFGLYCKSMISRFGLDPDPMLKKFALDTLRYLTADARVGVGRADYF